MKVGVGGVGAAAPKNLVGRNVGGVAAASGV